MSAERAELIAQLKFEVTRAGSFDTVMVSRQVIREAIAALQVEPAPVQAEFDEQREIERMRLAGISTAALGYWKVGDTIHPDYETVALHDVAALYEKYRVLYEAHPPTNKESVEPAPVQAELTDAWTIAQWEKFYGYRVNPKMPPDVDADFIRHCIAADRALRNKQGEHT